MFTRVAYKSCFLVVVAALSMTTSVRSARADDTCVIAVGDGVALYEEPSYDSDVIAYFDTGAKFFVRGTEDGGFLELQYVRDLNNRDVIGWMESKSIEWVYNCRYNFQSRQLGRR